MTRGGSHAREVPVAVVIDYIDAHRDRVVEDKKLGVEPICAVLNDAGVRIAPRTYYASKTRAPAARTLRDEELKKEIMRVFGENSGVYGARKVHAVLNREGIRMERCTVERLMRASCLQGLRRGRRPRTTLGAAPASGVEDLVERSFTAIFVVKRASQSVGGRGIAQDRWDVRGRQLSDAVCDGPRDGGRAGLCRKRCPRLGRAGAAGWRDSRKKAKRAKTPAGKRWIQLPDFLDALYPDLIEEAEPGGAVFTGARGGQLRRGNFRTRFWRPAWDGNSESEKGWLRSPLLPGFTFNEGRHTHRTWLAEDGVPEVARAARLGHRMRGMGEVYEHVTPALKEQVRTVLEERWRRSLQALKQAEREWVVETVPRLGEYYRAPDEKRAS